MNLLQIVQALHYEAKLPGSPPSAVTGLSGRAADLVRWAVASYNDIQRERDGKWKWLRGDFILNTAANTASYAYSACTDVATGQAITRFRGWDLDDRQPPFIYLLDDGQSTERELAIADWAPFRHAYVRGTHAAAYPSCITEDPAGQLHLGPTPDDVYRVTGNYWRSNQVLAAGDDTPEMPADYHMLIVFNALTKYGLNTAGHEIIARARHEGARLFEALSLNQAYGRFTLRFPPPLA